MMKEQLTVQRGEACTWGAGEARFGEQRPMPRLRGMALTSGEELEKIGGRFVGENTLSLEYPVVVFRKSSWREGQIFKY